MGERLKLLVIRCADLDRSVRFYEQVLGLAFVEERHGNGPRHFATVLDGTVFELYPRKGLETPDKDTRIGLTVENLDFRVGFLRGLGSEIVHEPAESPWGRRAVVRDPDGRAVELYETSSDSLIPAGQAHLANRIAEIIRRIFERPEMYVGSLAETHALGCVLWITHALWSEAAGNGTAFHKAISQISAEEDGDSKSYEQIFRERHPDASQEEVSAFVLQCWRRVSTRLGILSQ